MPLRVLRETLSAGSWLVVMRIERSWRSLACRLFLVSLLAELPLSATVAVPAARPATRPVPAAVVPPPRPFVPPIVVQPKVATPLSAGLAGIDELVTGGGDATPWKVRRVRFRDAVLAAIAQPGVVQIVIIGMGLMFVAVFVRRRRRRRIGWGVLPARSSMLSHRADPAP